MISPNSNRPAMEVSDLVNCSETSTGILAGGIDVKNIGFNGQAVQ